MQWPPISGCSQHSVIRTFCCSQTQQNGNKHVEQNLALLAHTIADSESTYAPALGLSLVDLLCQLVYVVDLTTQVSSWRLACTPFQQQKDCADAFLLQFPAVGMKFAFKHRPSKVSAAS